MASWAVFVGRDGDAARIEFSRFSSDSCRLDNTSVTLVPMNFVNNLKYLAIDETDRMLEKGHFDELLKLLEMINTNKASVSKRQNFVVSATLSLVHDLPKHLKHKRNKKQLTSDEKLKEIMNLIGVRSNPKIVDITSKAATAEALIESQIRCSLAEKDQFLYYLWWRCDIR